MTEEQFQKATKIRNEISKVFDNLKLAKRGDVRAAQNGIYPLNEVSPWINDVITTLVIADLEKQLKDLQANLNSI
jgi:hypothetical protein